MSHTGGRKTSPVRWEQRDALEQKRDALALVFVPPAVLDGVVFVAARSAALLNTHPEFLRSGWIGLFVCLFVCLFVVNLIMGRAVPDRISGRLKTVLGWRLATYPHNQTGQPQQGCPDHTTVVS